MAKKQSKYLWAKVGLYAFWGILGAFALVMIAFYGADLFSSVGADPGGAGAGNTGVYRYLDDAGNRQITTESGFNDYLCSIFYYANGFIAALVVLMIMIAGIIYATSQGQGSGDSGIGLAKNMIISAISGALLYMMASWLVGGCDQGSGFLSDLFSRYADLGS